MLGARAFYFKLYNMWEFEEQFRKEKPETIGETDSHFDLDKYKDWLEKKIENDSIVRKDKNGKPIRVGEKFKFKFLKTPNAFIEFTGSFDWHEDELRYEIDIWDDDQYVCLSYLPNGVMYDFELL